MTCNDRTRRNDMATIEPRDNEPTMNTPPIVSQQEWEAAHQQLLLKEKAFTRSRDALAAERRRMPWLAVDKKYEFEGPNGKASLLDLFEGRPQLIVYRAFFEPGVFGWPEHACRGCSLVLQLSLVASDSSYLWDDCVEVSHVGRLGKRPCLA